VQLMYVARDPQDHHPVYFDLMRDLLSAMPSSSLLIQEINNHILSGDYYRALKESRKLIAHEAKILAKARESAGAAKFQGAA